MSEEDQNVHQVSLDDELSAEAGLDVFKEDPDYAANEAKYAEIKRDILGEESEEDDDGDGDGDDEDDDEEEDEEEAAARGAAEAQAAQIRDATETNLVNLRRTIYLTIMSALDFEEAGHKLMKINIAPGQEKELCTMILECCSQERTYLKYYGLLASRFCFLNQAYQVAFDDMFAQQARPPLHPRAPSRPPRRPLRAPLHPLAPPAPAPRRRRRPAGARSTARSTGWRRTSCATWPSSSRTSCRRTRCRGACWRTSS